MAEGNTEGGAVERFLYRRVPLWIPLLCCELGLVLAIVFGAFILYAARGGKQLQWLQGPALAIADAPALVLNFGSRSRNPYLSPPGTPAARGGIWRNTAQPFVDPGFLLAALYDPVKRRPVARLVRLSDGKVLRDFEPAFGAIAERAKRDATPVMPLSTVPNSMQHPDLLDDGSIVFVGKYVLSRADACGVVKWTHFGHHHSIERDSDGALWSTMRLGTPDRPGAAPDYHADALGRLTPDGKLTYLKSIGRIFSENGLDPLVLGHDYTNDPFHLNDIQPVLADGPYWKRGDVFFSLRNQSMVALFRPSTGKILWYRIGPWIGQHDVSILDDHRISVLDNHVSLDAGRETVIGNSHVLVYDFATNTVTSPWEDVFRRNALTIESGGRGLAFDNGDLFVEDSNDGSDMRVSPQGIVRWRFVSADAKGARYSLFWSRYLDPARYATAIRAALAARC